MKDQLKEKIRSLVHEVYYGDVKSDKMDADKVIDQALTSILALVDRPMMSEERYNHLFDIALALDTFKYKCYGQFRRPTWTIEEYKKFIMKNAPCSYDIDDYKPKLDPEKVCHKCGGEGNVSLFEQGATIYKCPKCQGAGHIPAKEDEAGHKIDKEGFIIYDDRCAICNPVPEKSLKRKDIAEILFKTENPKFSHYWQDNIKVKEHEGDCIGIHGECRKCEVEHYFELADAILAHNAPEKVCPEMDEDVPVNGKPSYRLLERRLGESERKLRAMNEIYISEFPQAPVLTAEKGANG